jgi:SAM-dependent methyltransferase
MTRPLRTASYSNYNRLSTKERNAFWSNLIIFYEAIKILGCEAFGIDGLKRVECNICGWRGRKFINFYTGYQHVYKNSVCPGCYSHPRHRAYYIYITKLFSAIEKKIKVLHFSPEPFIANIFTASANVEYLSVDIDPLKAMRCEDITKLSFKAESFDMIICIHVFEHIHDDQKAMQEVYRVLKTGGLALLDVPIDFSLATTYEDSTITSPEGRTKAFWQWDHLRLYGRDYKDKLAGIGFRVEEDDYISFLGDAYAEKHGIEQNPSYLCSK